MHPCEEYIVCKTTVEQIPYFNAFIFLENKTQVGKVDEVFGPMNEVVCHLGGFLRLWDTICMVTL
jgi:H/ACA ribonucleoprotein complex subunit 1